MTSLNTQNWNPEQYAKNARFVSDLAIPVVDLLSPQSGESILDLGCGDGALTLKLKEFGCLLTAVDASAEMIAAAKSSGLHARVINGHSMKFYEEFDAVFSNAALHWMKSPQKVLNGVWRALKPGGRFVAEFGGYGNVITIVTAIETALTSRRGTTVADPWYFPKKDEYKILLEKTGFKVNFIELIQRPTKLPGDVSGWLRTFAQSYTGALPVSERQEFIAEIVETLRPKLCDEHGNWTADYVRLRFSAIKPENSENSNNITRRIYNP